MMWKKEFKIESCNKHVVINVFLKLKMLTTNLRKDLLLTGEDKIMSKGRVMP